MTTPIRLPNGEIIEIATNDPKAAAAAARKVWASRQAPKLPKAPPKKGRGLGATIGDAAGKVVDTLTGGYGDELAAGAEVLGNKLKTTFGFEGTGRDFDEAQENFQDEQADFSRNHGVSSGAATGTGIAGSMLMPGLKVAKGAGAVARTVDNVATGAFYGGVSGAGQGDGLGERTRNAVEGALFGAGTGLAADPLARGVTAVGRNVRNALLPYISREGGRKVAQAQAHREIDTALADAGFTPTEAADAVRDRAALNVPASVSDLDDTTRQLTGYASRGMGPGQRAVREAVKKRQSNMAQRTRQHVDDTLGSTVNPHQQSARLTEEARTRAAPLYREAYEQPVIQTPGLHEVATSPAGPAAITAGARQIRQTPMARRNPGSEAPFRPGPRFVPEQGLGAPGGNPPLYETGQVPVLETWDGAKRYLDDLEFDTNSPFIARPEGMTSDTRAIDLTRRQLLDELDQQVPVYREARQAFEGPTKDKQAFRLGLEDLPGSRRNTANDATDQMGRLNDSQTEQFRLGDRTRLADEIYGSKSGVRRWGDATAPINANDARTDLLRSIHGDEATDQLMERATAERDAHLTYREVFGNSATRGRQAVDEGMDATTGTQVATQLASGRPLAAAWTILSDAGRGRFGRYGEDLKAELARMLTDTNVSSVEDAMRLVEQRAAMDAAFAEKLQKAAAELTKVGTIQAVGQSGDETGLYGPTD
ncbi:hypothetical protein BSL82_03685 [Tardibacter chloracetimidivorans]|uniref:Uncharacterized protein n=1 Tax=Tardibacter chloracetimidivorans TaxID=1921510 RepID=A0A1L3ZSB6_9SPHN|nr:hypothetical protein [Tardibacter chloracetimidivorans]API58518.1 hypothetical protein BSL82_03685 [Tardibacter chloracetimidivorans]